MTIQPLALAAILSLVGTPQKPAHVVGSAEHTRLDTFAGHIATAVNADGAAIPFEGGAAKEAAALLLVAIAKHESGFKQAVIDCKERGALGDATAWQLLSQLARGPYSFKELCASVPLAAGRALATVSAYAERCKMGGNLALLRGYAKGSCHGPAPIRVFRRGVLVVVDADAGLTRCQTWERLAAKAGLVGASCYRRQPIEFKNGPYETPASDAPRL